MQYDSKIIDEQQSDDSSANASGDHFKLIYYFGSPEYTKVFEEYLIMNEMGLIGNVGGTLGMFIGFSFTGVIAFVISFFKHGKNT